jgi:hypothetical protein
MTPTLPRTVRAVDTAQLLDLAQEAAMHGFSQRGSRSTGYESTSPQKRRTTCSRHSCSGSRTVPRCRCSGGASNC